MSKKKNIAGLVILAAGIILIAASVILLVVNAAGRRNSIVENEKTVAFFENLITVRENGSKDGRADTTMPVLEYNGEDYAAIIGSEVRSLKLPVLASWDKNSVNTVPCRFTGNPYDGSLVIGGVDAKGQFDFLSSVDIGEEFTVTDMKGEVFTYTVVTVKHAHSAEADVLIDSEYDFSFFAKSARSGEVLIVRCKLK